MEFIYQGREGGPAEVEVYGITFTSGMAVEVENGAIFEGVDVCSKLSGNPRFVTVNDGVEVLASGSTEGDGAAVVKQAPKISKKKVSKKK